MKTLINNFIFVVLLSLISCAQTSPANTQNHLTAAETRSLLKSNKEVVILDVRTPDEFKQGHIKGARNINFYDDNFEQQISRLDTSKTYLMYCASGNRSGKATNLMTGKNFNNVYNSKAGFADLKSEGLPTE
jgi:phage shock protein E